MNDDFSVLKENYLQYQLLQLSKLLIETAVWPQNIYCVYPHRNLLEDVALLYEE